MAINAKQHIIHYFDDEDYRWALGGLVSICMAMALFIKNHFQKLLINRNNDIERRLIELEQGQQDLIDRVRNINHKIDNNETLTTVTLEKVLEKVEGLSKKDNGLILEFYKLIDLLNENKEERKK